MNRFECLNCGSTELMFEKWVRCRERILISSDEHIEYCEQQIDDSNMLGAEYHFVCACCDKAPTLYGNTIQTEDELLEYLTMSMEQRSQMMDDYEHTICEQDQEEEEAGYNIFE